MTDICKCGHRRLQHIREDGPCRPGYACDFSCQQFIPAEATSSWACAESDCVLGVNHIYPHQDKRGRVWPLFPTTDQTTNVTCQECGSHFASVTRLDRTHGVVITQVCPHTRGVLSLEQAQDVGMGHNDGVAFMAWLYDQGYVVSLKQKGTA